MILSSVWVPFLGPNDPFFMHFLVGKFKACPYHFCRSSNWTTSFCVHVIASRSLLVAHPPESPPNWTTSWSGRGGSEARGRGRKCVGETDNRGGVASLALLPKPLPFQDVVQFGGLFEDEQPNVSVTLSRGHKMTSSYWTTAKNDDAQALDFPIRKCMENTFKTNRIDLFGQCPFCHKKNLGGLLHEEKLYLFLAQSFCNIILI